MPRFARFLVVSTAVWRCTFLCVACGYIFTQLIEANENKNESRRPIMKLEQNNYGGQKKLS
jgi:hypothetical protein